jgi:hypothetical protein
VFAMHYFSIEGEEVIKVLHRARAGLQGSGNNLIVLSLWGVTFRRFSRFDVREKNRDFQ